MVQRCDVGRSVQMNSLCLVAVRRNVLGDLRDSSRATPVELYVIPEI